MSPASTPQVAPPWMSSTAQVGAGKVARKLALAAGSRQHAPCGEVACALSRLLCWERMS
jgi:hypothetical protein